MSDERTLKSIGQILISVTDIDRAVEYYRDTLEMQFLFQVQGMPMAFFQCGETRIFLGEEERPDFKSSPVIYYQVDSVDAAHEKFKSKGVRFVDEPHVVHRTESMELWMAFCKDPDGNHIGLMEERAI